MALAMAAPEKKKKLHGRFIALAIVISLCVVGIFFHFFFPSRMTLSHAKVMDNKLSLTFKVSGLINGIAGNKGHDVTKGSTIISLDSQPYTVVLKEEEAKLTSLEALLPAGHSSLHAKNATVLNEETYKKLLVEEAKAKQDILSASESHAKSALAKVRKQSLFHQGKISQKEYDEAMNLFDEEEKNLAQRKVIFEEVSGSRASAEKEISRIRVMQKQSGVDSVPAEARIKAYESQLANVEFATSNLAATKIIAPVDGTIVDLFVSQGVQVNAGQVVVLFRPKNPNSLMISGELDQYEVESLQYGQKCEVTIPSLGGGTYLGQIVDFLQKQGSPIEVQVLVDMSNQNYSGTIEPGAYAHVTILD